jgi:hypothetical protein
VKNWKDQTMRDASRRGVLLKGRAAIADYLGLTVREVDHQTETNGLPVFHLGRSVAAKVEDLKRWVDERANSSPPPMPLRRRMYRSR